MNKLKCTARSGMDIKNFFFYELVGVESFKLFKWQNMNGYFCFIMFSEWAEEVLVKCFRFLDHFTMVKKWLSLSWNRKIFKISSVKFVIESTWQFSLRFERRLTGLKWWQDLTEIERGNYWKLVYFSYFRVKF